jgi:TrmH family RNA methyltransferase
MLTKNKSQFIRQLHQKKYRQQHRMFIVEGTRMIEELVNSTWQIVEVIATQKWLAANSELLPGYVSSTGIAEKEIARLSAFSTAPGVLAVVRMPAEAAPGADILADYVLLLDGISDPGNMGTILRTADWFGFRNVICSNDSVELFNSKVVQATMGSLFRVNVFYVDILEFLQQIPDEIPIAGAMLSGNSLPEMDLGEKGIFVIGSESHGIRPATQRLLTQRLHIPAWQPDGRPESLNASIAAALICYELRRPKT